MGQPLSLGNSGNSGRSDHGHGLVRGRISRRPLAAFDVHKTGEFGGRRAPEMDPGRGAGDRLVPEPAAPRGDHDILVSLSLPRGDRSRPGREDRSGTLRGRGCVRMLGRSLDGSPIGTLWGLLPRMTHGVYPKVRGPVNSDWPGTRRWGPSCREGASGILSGLPRPEAGRHVVGCREAGSGEDSGPSGMGLKEGTMSTMAASRWARRRGPEVLLAVLAGVVFLGFLARSTSGASASSAPRPRRSTRSRTGTGWSRGSKGVPGSRSPPCRAGRSPR